MDRKKIAAFLTFFLLLSLPFYAYSQDGEMTVEVFPVYYHSAREAMESVSIAASEEGRLVVDERTNSIIVRDRKENVEMIRVLLEKMDVKPKQIRITTGFIGKDQLEKWGLKVRWYFSGPDWSLGDVPREISMGHGVAAAPLMATRRMDAHNRQVLLLQANSKGTIIVSYILPDADYFLKYGMRYGYISPAAQFRELGAAFTVLPRVTASGDMELKITPKLTRTDGGSDIELGRAHALVILKNGQSAVLGGGGEGEESFGSRFLTSHAGVGKKEELLMTITAEVE